MLAILIYRPSIWLAIWLGVLVAFRRVPWFANEIARMLSLDEQVGMTTWAGRVLLPAWDGAVIMSPLEAGEYDHLLAVPMPTTIPTADTAPIAISSSEYNGNLSDSGRVQFEERARTIAELYEAGIITNISKAICKVYRCSVQSAAKTDSTYQMALKAVNRHLTRNKPQFRAEDGATTPATYPITKEPS